MAGPRIDCGSLAAAYAEGCDVYDDLWSPVIRPGGVAVIDAMKVGDTRRVLDVGAGTGALTEDLRAAAPRAAIYSLDPSPAMLRFVPEPRGDGAVVAEAGALPAASSSVDAVLLAYVLFHLLDPVAGLREVARVVRVGGRVGTVTWASQTQPVAGKVWDQTLDDLGVSTLPAPSNHTGLDTTDAVTALVDRTELRVANVWIHELEHTFTRERFWKLRTSAGINRARLATLDADSRRAVMAELRHRLDQLAQTDYTFRGTVVCSVSEKAA